MLFICPMTEIQCFNCRLLSWHGSFLKWPLGFLIFLSVIVLRLLFFRCQEGSGQLIEAMTLRICKCEFIIAGYLDVFRDINPPDGTDRRYRPLTNLKRRRVVVITKPQFPEHHLGKSRKDFCRLVRPHPLDGAGYNPSSLLSEKIKGRIGALLCPSWWNYASLTLMDDLMKVFSSILCSHSIDYIFLAHSSGIKNSSSGILWLTMRLHSFTTVIRVLCTKKKLLPI